MSTENNKIAIATRNEFGDGPSRRLRRAGRIPAIIYGCGKENRACSVNADEWKVFAAGGSHLVTLVKDDEEIHALIREVQFNHLKNYVVHIDFQEVNMDAEISSSVPVHARGESYGAAHGGLLEQDVHEIEVICRPADLPEFIEVDVTALNIGDSLAIGQLQLPQGVRTSMDPEMMVFHVVRPKEESEESENGEGTATEPEAINEKKTEARAAEKEEKK